MSTETNNNSINTSAGNGRRMYGRQQIFTNEAVINAGNVVQELNKALPIHNANRADEQYLLDYMTGKQPICDRVKAVNNEICNRVVVNIANQIVTFKKAEFAGEPIQYVSRGTKKSVPKKVEKLNSMLTSEGKTSKDMELAGWMFTYGVGYRLLLNDKSAQYKDLYDEAPFELYTLDSRNTFVVRLNHVSRRVVMGVTYAEIEPSLFRYTVYTDNAVYTIDGSALSAGQIKSVVYHNFGRVPIYEYPCNSVRMGAFEVVIDLLDAINLMESNRLDGVEQFIQALMVFKGVDIDRETYLKLKDLGAITLPPAMSGSAPPDVTMLNNQLDQSQTQTLVDDLYQIVLQIVGMPSQGNANTSDSSNNGAVILKNGWWNAEARALETQGMWVSAEIEMLKGILKICRDANALDGLAVSDVKVTFGRHAYEDKLTKTQSFTTLIGAGVPPIQAYTVSGMVTDPEAAAIAYEDYRKEREAAEMQAVVSSTDAARSGDTNEYNDDYKEWLKHRRAIDGDGVVNE